MLHSTTKPCNQVESEWGCFRFSFSTHTGTSMVTYINLCIVSAPFRVTCYIPSLHLSPFLLNGLMTDSNNSFYTYCITNSFFVRFCLIGSTSASSESSPGNFQHHHLGFRRPCFLQWAWVVVESGYPHRYFHRFNR